MFVEVTVGDTLLFVNLRFVHKIILTGNQKALVLYVQGENPVRVEKPEEIKMIRDVVNRSRN